MFYYKGSSLTTIPKAKTTKADTCSKLTLSLHGAMAQGSFTPSGFVYIAIPDKAFGNGLAKY